MKYHMRRQDKEIKDPSLLKKILKQTKYVTIAMCKDNRPYLVTLSHGYDEENNCIYFHCAREGKKLDYLKANDIVWGQALIDYGYEGDCTQHYATVMFQGKISFVDEIERKHHAFTIMKEHLDSSQKGLEEYLKSDISNTLVGKISIEFLSGKKSSKKLEI
jgi:nitroimidazol reductase NimA-like FMN-containing flavoprotein (pyridoxamine 5'-phosphate oxidase superfamily)